MILFLILFSVVAAKPILVIEFIRHGARSPLKKDPFFPYDNWPLYGELTPAGERQLYLLGRLRRSQYIEEKDLLPNIYDPSLIYARSSDIRRTMMSLQSYLLGLYPTGLSKLNNNQIDKSKDFLLPKLALEIDPKVIEGLKDNPNPHSIPVHHFEIVNSTKDHMLLFSDCPISEATNEKYMKDKYNEIFDKYMSIWKSLTEQYKNITMEELKKGMDALNLCDFLLCADSDNVRPSHVTDKVLEQCAKLKGEIQADRVAYDEKCIKASTKPFAIEIIDWMQKAIKKETEVRYVVYGAHDVTLSRLLVGLKKMDSKIKWDSVPPFAANILFELDENEKVKVLFNEELIHNSDYKDFKMKFEEVGDVNVTYADACRAPTNLRFTK